MVSNDYGPHTSSDAFNRVGPFFEGRQQGPKSPQKALFWNLSISRPFPHLPTHLSSRASKSFTPSSHTNQSLSFLTLIPVSGIARTVGEKGCLSSLPATRHRHFGIGVST